MSIKKELAHIIEKSLKDNGIELELDEITIEIPKDIKFGHYSTNIAMILAKKLKSSPLDIAKKIESKINSDIIDEVKIMNPGFINFYLTKSKLLSEINKINIEGRRYGKSFIGNNNKVNIEYVSANPTGTLHIGHGRGATYGDNLSRIFSYCGYDVTREYYINDAGNQMDNLGISIKERYKELCGLDCNLPEDGYYGKEIVAIAEKIYNEFKDAKLYEDISFFKKIGLDILLDQIKKDLDTFRVSFDVFTSEQSLYDKGYVENVLDKFKKNNLCYISDNALWIKTSEYGDEKDRVIIKNDGNYTYLLPDIAYHINKYERGYNQIIDVLGADHHGYINRLKGSLSMLGYNSEIINIELLQMVRLLKDGEEIKISKRTGKTITLNDLIDEVGINATRYFFASKSLDTQMDFDLSLAVKKSNENPIYYVEYANARISKILRHKYINYAEIKTFKTIIEDMAYQIINKLMNFEDIVISAANKKAPHVICNYVYELSTLFHSYYANSKFITDDEEYTNEHLALLNAIKIVINNSLNLIGIIPREEM